MRVRQKIALKETVHFVTGQRLVIKGLDLWVHESDFFTITTNYLVTRCQTGCDLRLLKGFAGYGPSRSPSSFALCTDKFYGNPRN